MLIEMEIVLLVIIVALVFMLGGDFVNFKALIQHIVVVIDVLYYFVLVKVRIVVKY